jgi:hypothetical protein
MGRDKALLPWPPRAGGDTFLAAAIRLFFSRVDVVLVVAGKNEAALDSHRLRQWRVAGRESRARARPIQLLASRPAGGSEPRPRRRNRHARRPTAGPASNPGDARSRFRARHRTQEMGGDSRIPGPTRTSNSLGPRDADRVPQRSRNLERARCRARAPERDRVRSGRRPAGSPQHRYARAICSLAVSSSALNLIPGRASTNKARIQSRRDDPA